LAIRRIRRLLSTGSFGLSCLGEWLDIWWFQIVSNMNFIFHNIWDNPSHWLIFFKMVKNHQPV
jgi:hypothetical protein